MSLRNVAACALLACCLLTSSALASIDPSLLAGMKARAIGPAGMSGRIADVAAVVSDPNIIYVGASTGGLWKSIDGGLAWTPIFDEQPVAAIGAIAIDPSNSDNVWVGTGEANLRNSVSVGNGVYRSRDAGRTWQHLGLSESERIHRIFVHPRDSETAYVAVKGKLWGDSEERGVYRTRDGGRTWQRVLYVDERTGCSDLAIDPTNPDKLLAAMHEFRRTPWFFTSGGPGSGLYVTVDGGENWKKITPENGLPEGDLGRIGVAFAPSDPRLAYAFVEAKENGFYRSTDGGFTWKKTRATENIGNRPFYYADVRVDPDFPDRVYSLYSLVSVSDDGGDSFRVLIPWNTAHPDHHAMWIHPHDGRFMINGNDGGVYISTDRGETWRFVSNLPVAQFYHIAVDMEVPYGVYGGMQDNGSWKGSSQVWENGGIRNHHWQEVAFGDGFDTLPMPDDAMRGYAMSQEGYLYRWDMRTGEVRTIRPAPPEGTETLRFNWNAGLAQDPFDVDTIYYGSQFVHRSRDRGLSWETISGDLTTNRPEWQEQAKSGGLTPDVTGAENFTSIVAIAPSPIARDVIWVGTDDGRLHVTRDGGVNWESVEERIKGVPKNTWIPHIHPSSHDAGTAFVVFDNHRRSEMKPYVQKTTDHGRRWQDLSTPELSGYALSIVQDPVNADLLFVGTEFGLYVSLDGGKRWMKWTHGVPTCSVMDMVIHPRDHDLVLGTHGRSAFVLDDIRPLRTLDALKLAAPLHLFEIADAQQYWPRQTGAERFPGATEFRGENRAYGALLNVIVNGEGLKHPDPRVHETERERDRAQRRATSSEPGAEEPAASGATATQLRVEILDEQGAKIRSFEREVHRGLNRIVWDLRSDPFRRPPRGDDDEDWFGTGTGPEVMPGSYRVVVRFGEHEASGTVQVLSDPRMTFTVAERQANWDARQRAGRLQEVLAIAVQRIVDLRSDADGVLARIERHRREERHAGVEWEQPEQAPLHDLEKTTRDLKRSLDELEKSLRVAPGTKGIVDDATPLGELSTASWFLGSTWDAPSPTVLEYLRRAEARAAEAVRVVNAWFEAELPAYRENVQRANELQPLLDLPDLELPPR
jgi:photosystem II stability/assembly factor-like uncharacterized protein